MTMTNINESHSILTKHTIQTVRCVMSHRFQRQSYDELLKLERFIMDINGNLFVCKLKIDLIYYHANNNNLTQQPKANLN
jgi:hypothetical protein